MDKKDLYQSRVVFTDNPHGYHLDGKKLRGVTGILSDYIFRDKYYSVSDEVLAKAAERGSRVHEQCRVFDMIGISASEEVQAYADIKKQFGITSVANEYTVSDEESVASKVDLVAHTHGCGENEVILADYKTTSHLDVEYLSWQLSIYKELFERQNPNIRVKGIMGIWLPLSKYGKPRGEWIKPKPKEEVVRLLDAVRNGEPYIPSLTKIPPMVLSLQERCYETLLRIKEAEEEKAVLVDALKQAMEKYDVKKWDMENITITRTLPTQQRRFDSKAFKEVYPKLYDEYTKVTNIDGSIKITLKKK